MEQNKLIQEFKFSLTVWLSSLIHVYDKNKRLSKQAIHRELSFLNH